MATFVKYNLDDGGTVLVEVEETQGGVVSVARKDKNVIIEAGNKFREALHSAKESTAALMKELGDLPIEETEVVFGLKATGEAGIFAIGKVGAEANFQVTLKWKRHAPPK
jgi:hypothetical protein